MAKNQSRHLPDAVVKKDKDAFAALKKVAGYAPQNPACNVNKIQTAFDAMSDAIEAEAQAQANWNSATGNTIAAQWQFHNLILTAKDQVKAQFGADSNEVKSVGLKKKSEYRNPKRNNGGQKPS